jgi:hypothetical protein
MDGSGDLFFGHGQPQAGEGIDQIVVLPLHWSGTLLHRVLLPFCVEENDFSIDAHASVNDCNTLLSQGLVKYGAVACPLRSGKHATLLQLVVPGLADPQLRNEFIERNEATSR